MKDIFDTLACILFIAAFFPYGYAIWRDRKIPVGTLGKAEPKKVSWIIWAILDGIALAGMYAKGTVNGQIIGANIGAWAVIFLALKYGSGGWTRVDKFCLGGAALGIALWATFGNATLGIITSCIVAFLGSFPTFMSGWEDPGRENRRAWTLFWVSCVCAIIAIKDLTLEIALQSPFEFLVNHPDSTAQPLTFFAVESVMMLILFIRPLFIRGSEK